MKTELEALRISLQRNLVDKEEVEREILALRARITELENSPQQLFSTKLISSQEQITLSFLNPVVRKFFIYGKLVETVEHYNHIHNEKVDWDDERQLKYCIVSSQRVFAIYQKEIRKLLAFRNAEAANTFLQTFRADIQSVEEYL